MKTATIEKWVKLLAFLYYHPNCEAPAAYTKLDLKKDATYKTLGKWIKEGMVTKVRKEEIVMGKAKELFSLTSEGKKLFFRLREALDDKQKNKI